MACTGDLPPNCKSGQAFINDPTLHDQVSGQDQALLCPYAAPCPLGPPSLLSIKAVIVTTKVVCGGREQRAARAGRPSSTTLTRERTTKMWVKKKKKERKGRADLRSRHREDTVVGCGGAMWGGPTLSRAAGWVRLDSRRRAPPPGLTAVAARPRRILFLLRAHPDFCCCWGPDPPPIHPS
jgi:hypothetical protein